MESWLNHWWSRDMVVGVIASAAMSLYMMIVMAAMGLGFWTFLNVVAAAVPMLSPPTAGFALLPTLTGLVIQLAIGAFLALMYGVIAWAIAPAIGRHYKPALVTGVLYAALIYVWLGRLIGPAIDPALALLPKGHFLVGYLIFGAVTTLLITRGVRHRERLAAVTFGPGAPREAPSEQA